MNQRIKDTLLALTPFIAIILTWYGTYYFDLVPSWLNASPHKTVITFWQVISDGTLLKIVLISAANSIPAFISALFVAIALGTVVGMNATIRKIFYPLLSAIYPIPSLAWLPLIILIWGFTRETIWAVIFISSFMKMIYNMIGGVRGVNPNWILAAKNFGLTKFKIVFKVILPSALPNIMIGIRMGFGSSWRSLIGAEMLAVGVGGIGNFIWMAQWFLEFDKVLIGIIVIAVIGIFMEEIVFKQIEKMTLIRWGSIQ